MAHAQLPDDWPNEGLPAARRVRDGGRFVIAGIVGACVLGVGLGLWARPSTVERRDAPPPPRLDVEAEASDRRLQIVLDDGPAPLGALLEVMPAGFDDGRWAELPAFGDAAPGARPAGLMRVDSPVTSAPVTPADAGAVAALPAIVAAAAAKPKVEPLASKPPAAKAEAAPKASKKARTERTSTAAKSKTKATSETKTTTKARTATRRKSEPAKSIKPARTVQTKTAQTKTAQSTPSRSKAAAPTAERKVKRQAGRDVERVDAQRTKAAKASLQQTASKAPARGAGKKASPTASKPAAPKTKVAPRGEGPKRVARNDAKTTACALPDPGEALVCADPRLNQRDRQLQRAFRDAEAAGVPASALQRQQARWRQARTAAARDGSWAVEDVYEARIAELKDLARDARDF